MMQERTPRSDLLLQPNHGQIDKQLDAGIRWFDLRVRENDNGHQACSGNQHAGHTWDIYHGSTDLDLTFDQVLVWMNSFLSNNPTEAIICWIQTSEPGVNPEFSEVLDQYVTTNARIFLSNLRTCFRPISYQVFKARSICSTMFAATVLHSVSIGRTFLLSESGFPR
ncbi:MAG: hypothetical protein R2818_15960 [Flavobacteriales bacterium]